METATFAAGCFWCVEAIFASLKGVKSVVSGYSGGVVKSPSYDDVATGSTGHAETINIEFDPEVITYGDLLDVFWKLHDPTTLNRQGADVGTQYRSAIFYHDDAQELIAIRSKEEAQKSFDKPIVTEIVPFKGFFEAEEDHQEYYKKNSDKTYCKIVIDPKIKKLRKEFKKLVKK